MTILRGVVFLKSTHPEYAVGKRVLVTLTVTPNAGVLAAVDAAQGGEVSVATPATSLVYTTEDGTVLGTTGLPGTVVVTYGYVQPAYSSTGERTISVKALPDYSTGSYADTSYVMAFETYGTVFSAPVASAPPANTALPGTGLQARYFANGDLTGSPVLEVVEQPYFVGVNALHPTVPERPMSVRWTGVVKAPAAGKYRFKTKCDDGARLYLDGRLVLDFWATQNNREKLTGYYDFTAGQLVKVWLEMSNTELNATMEFSWETPATTPNFERVPVSALYSTDGTEALPPALAPPNQIRFSAEVVNRY